MKSIVFALLCLSLSAAAMAQTAEYNTKNGVALSGYDPVSYFNHAPAKGKTTLQYQYQGITYYFSNASNLEKFKNAPEKFEPQYGGWCAYAMGVDGSKVKIDPETYKITNGKLYLFYNFAFTNTLDYWNDNEDELLPKADDYWHKVLH